MMCKEQQISANILNLSRSVLLTHEEKFIHPEKVFQSNKSLTERAE